LGGGGCKEKEKGRPLKTARRHAGVYTADCLFTKGKGQRGLEKESPSSKAELKRRIAAVYVKDRRVIDDECFL